MEHDLAVRLDSIIALLDYITKENAKLIEQNTALMELIASESTPEKK